VDAETDLETNSGEAALVLDRVAIRVELTPHAVASVDPTTAVVSQLNRRGASVSHIPASLCDHGHEHPRPI
jgi:hypothetical protein